MLNALSPEIFIPHYWSVEAAGVTFYIDDFKMAKMLANIDRTIEMPNGFKLLVKVRNGIPPIKLGNTPGINANVNIVFNEANFKFIKLFNLFCIFYINIDRNIRERMKLAMAKRYNASTKALDLTAFHLDTDLRDIYCGLSRAPIFAAAADIITENISELEALNLDGNKIYSLDQFRNLLNKLPNLKILYLSNNKVLT